MPKINLSGGTTAVPNFFIDEYMPKANAEFVKVYVYALRYAGQEVSNGDIAERLGLLESDVVKAWNYWKKVGIVTEVGDVLVFRTGPVVNNEKTKEQSVRATRSEIARMFRSDGTLSSLCTWVQNSLGKTLSSTELSSLYSIYTELGLPADVITLLVGYCKERGKDNLKYIERVAASWKEKGIDNIDAAEELCRNEEEMRREESRLKEVLGIRADRKLTDSEKKYIESWTKELGYSPEVIGLAFDQTMLNTGKLSWPYLNTILKNWHGKGLKSTSDIESALAGRSSKNKFNNFVQKDDDTASLEQAAIRKRMKEQGVVM